MSTQITFRRATRDDLDVIVSMLADDHLGGQREQYTQPLPAAYTDAFQAIDADPNQELIVACASAQVVGVMQLTYIPYLTYQGGWRALIEGVRIHRQYRSQGLGRQMVEWATQRAKDKGCHMIQLTTDKTRPRAKSFYEDLGFVASHEGMKLHLKATP